MDFARASALNWCMHSTPRPYAALKSKAIKPYNLILLDCFVSLAVFWLLILRQKNRKPIKKITDCFERNGIIPKLSSIFITFYDPVMVRTQFSGLIEHIVIGDAFFDCLLSCNSLAFIHLLLILRWSVELNWQELGGSRFSPNYK